MITANHLYNKSFTFTHFVATVMLIVFTMSATYVQGAESNGVKPGQLAPEFTLKDLTGKTVSLSDHKGKIVVIEWFNPECPFVKLAHSRTLSLKGVARKHKKKGVVWLAINSNGPGKQGHDAAANKKAKKLFDMDYPLLLDPTGKVGKQYGAVRTPELFIINPKGVLVYRGAIDNTQGGDPSDAEPSPAKNFVDEALQAMYGNRVPPVKETTPWGCTVKYAK
jgi:peroxiredoxin